MRQITINGQPYLEEIQSYEHIIGNSIKVMVGIGTVQDNKFAFTIPQQFNTYIIADKPARVSSITGEVFDAGYTDYSDLITQTSGAITLESLWSAVDLVRSRE